MYLMGECFIKARTPKYRDIYDNYKERLKNSEKIIGGKVIEGKESKMWKDTSDAHRHNAAMRYMVKMFLIDLYAAWRKIEGLEVHAPYHEVKLGIKHTGSDSIIHNH